ncbi:NAD(P)H-dependent oxidoreductase [Flagellatimonas centrodinii]|uniref:FMN-dependent NADH-azoreductase n=1 Tax=Flagellatimonas centrodinii TaxID=2806210 RepID=UPI001FFCB6F6|nr:NAD(P)H-dependent oxidoreductase [Flagellatimonas centrodinii]ULQ45580.1 NAD(P)H-dependent oxidoreductase [Flagellatimonas centrodinii]
MTTLLQITTSLFSEEGQSSKLAQNFVATWQARHPDGHVVVRDLAANPLPHLTAERFQAFLAKPDDRSPAQRAIVAESDALIAELRAADAVVLGLPMYNFGIPSTLKAYIDHIARAGVTFRYTANGPEGLLADRKLTVLAARGGQYLGTPKDTQSGYVRDFFNFIGIRDIDFIYAEGLAVGEEARRAALDAAHQRIDALAA